MISIFRGNFSMSFFSLMENNPLMRPIGTTEMKTAYRTADGHWKPFALNTQK